MSLVRPLAALAALAATVLPSVAADSGVAIAGRIDVGPQYINDGTTHQRRVDGGNYTASRLIFRGNEDLGDGLNALFYLESRFNADLGANQSAAKFFNGGSFVGLKDDRLGTITLGRQYTPIFWSFLFADDTGPLKLHSYSALQSIQRSNFARISAAASPIKSAGSLDTIAGGIYSVGITSAFEDNQIIYQSPTWAGFNGRLAVGAPEGYAAGNGKIYGGNLEYRNGTTVFVTAGATRKEGRIPAGGGVKEVVNEQVVGGLFETFKGLKFWGNFHPWKVEGANADLKGHDWMAGISYWFSNQEIWANYAAKQMSSCNACNSRGFGVGYHYFLSKKTELYASIARVGNDPNSGNVLNGFAPGQLGQSVKGASAGIALTF